MRKLQTYNEKNDPHLLSVWQESVPLRFQSTPVDTLVELIENGLAKASLHPVPISKRVDVYAYHIFAGFVHDEAREEQIQKEGM